MTWRELIAQNRAIEMQGMVVCDGVIQMKDWLNNLFYRTIEAEVWKCQAWKSCVNLSNGREEL